MKRYSNSRGFTLVEVLIAVVIVSVGLLAVASMQTVAMSGGTFSRNTSSAVELAEEMIDRVRASAGIEPELYNGMTTAACAGAPSVLSDCTDWESRLDSVNSGLSNATGTVTVTPDSPIPGAAVVEVTVTWGVGGTRSMTIRTIVETWLT